MKKYLFLLFILIQFTITSARDTMPRFYFSWGYNKEWYANNNIRITQNDLQNKYTFVKVKGVDKTGWSDGIFNKDLTIPQYNYRLGYNINKKWAFELNFDHTKYQVAEQTLHMSGTYGGRMVDSSFAQTRNNLSYELNNGANFFLFNMVRKIDLYKDIKERVNVKLLLKGGAGFVYPHVENTIMGQSNKPHF